MLIKLGSIIKNKLDIEEKSNTNAFPKRASFGERSGLQRREDEL
ncbi:hypothetical protein LOT_1144 [Lentilactobacillus otakiensis DSM 19908 = JCM 15040]|uniref:Uncharacterized protein n=1 Tax=Lentilactobacillus otakiensis DSM 19908 = JCM 15040 TaxID=1423780 RepID=S4NL35_9LACO|nr:hypothetical protein LOT_1144 [Lentilactobacillus otakiensis DSM 19908 = JCM 15040]